MLVIKYLKYVFFFFSESRRNAFRKSGRLNPMKGEVIGILRKLPVLTGTIHCIRCNDSFVLYF